MLVGIVTATGEPVVQLPVAGQDWPAVVDTGFNGDLELPEALRPFVNAEFRGQQPWLLASGHGIEEDMYSVDFPFDGQTVFAEASFVADGVILIGTGILRQHQLNISFPAETVPLERLT